MRRGKKLAGLITAAALLVGSSMQIMAAPEEQKGSIPKEMKQVAESEGLILYLDEEETDFAIEDKKTGKVWFSNPQDCEEDTFASVYYQKVMKSQLQIQYYNENVQSSVMDNYNDSIKEGQFEISYLEQGVTITYTLGEAKSELLLPNSISRARMESFTANMTEKQIKKINRNYTLEGENYVLRGGVKDYLKEELAEYFEAAGYTQAEYEVDSAVAEEGSEDDEKPWFTIPVTYELEGDNLVVTIDPETVSYNENGYYLVDIDVLPYFAAAKTQENGYIFVPDGSGALIHLDNTKTNASAYAASVFGQDKSKQVLNKTKSEIEERLTIKLPVYGIKEGEQALFAVIEQGAGYADISADIAGRTTSYYNAYAGFSYLQYGPAALSDMVGANSYQLYGEKTFADCYAIRYAFLTGDEANYSGMAAYYREYLAGRGELNRQESLVALPFYTEYIGAIDKYETFLGVKYKAVESLTTFAQAAKISSQLSNLGVDNQKAVYTGWANGGLHGTANNKLKVVSAVQKGGMNLSQYLAEMKDNQVDTYMTVDMQYVYQDKLFDGYSKLQYAPGYFDHSSITVGSYNTANGRWQDTIANLISPHYAVQIAEKIGASAGKNKISGIQLGTASWDLYSDYLEERYTDRQLALQQYQQGFAALQNQGISLMGDNANTYSLPYVSHVVNVPLESNGYLILDQDIPFYEMVLHGFLPYAGEALNMADDYETTLLKSVEGGAGLHFQWIYEDNSLLKETDYEQLYAVHYSNWLEQAAADYERLNTELGSLQGQVIQQHDYLTDELVKVQYEDGTSVYVNYAKTEVTYGDITVPARDFAVVKSKGGE